MEEKILRNYARLIARSGVNVVPGQEVTIAAPVEQPNFVEMLTEECYLAGAGEVWVDWMFQPVSKLGYKYRSLESLSHVKKWEEEKYKHTVRARPARIHLSAEDPDGMKGMDQGKYAQVQQAVYAVLGPYRKAIENGAQWCVAAVPGLQWARKVFPGLSDGEAVERLWQAILRCARADGPDPVAAWEAHSADIHRRCDWLNSLRLRRLLYKSESTGTDFSVGLIPNMLFCGGSERAAVQGVAYNPNIPSEEVFTTPMRGQAEGFVRASMPLSYQGVMIEDFSLRFENGRVVEVHAGKNEEALRLMVGMDEGASMLGECALVPWRNPIRESGILFYNTLFDENAVCHLALGRGYSSCMKDFEKYSQEDFAALGVNESMIHVDFMIGAADLNITGITAGGERVQIFKDGGWAVV